MDTSKSTTEHGLFWVKNHEQNKLWGTLRINEINEARLETFGSLIEHGEENPQTIVGQIKGGQLPVTLLNCFPINTQYAQPAPESQWDWSQQTCLVNVVLEGLALEEDQEAAFAEAIINISTLSKWVNPKLVSFELTKSPSGKIKTGILLNDREDESVATTFRGKEITITLRFNPKEQRAMTGPINSYSVEDNCFLVLEKADGGKLLMEDVTALAAAIQDLLSICCNETAVVTSLNVKQEQDDLNYVKVFLRMKGYKVEKKGKYPYASLEFDSIGGMKGIARWLHKTEKYHPSTAFLTSKWYNDTAYSSDNLSRTYTAVEGLNARKKSHSQANMNVKDLAQFVDRAIPDFHNIANSSAKDWATKVKDVRNKTITHLDPTGAPTTNGLALLRMADILYVAGASFLLREIGIEEPEIRTYIDGCYQSGLLH